MAKTTGNIALAWQDIANNAVVIGAAIDVSTLRVIALHILVGRAVSTLFNTNYPTFRIEASGKASGNDAWIPILPLQPSLGNNVAQTTANGAISAGATTCVVTSATNIAAGDSLFLGHTTTVANYEIIRVKSIAGTTVTFEEACTNAHDTGALITSQPHRYFPALDMSPYSRLRLVVDNGGNGVGIKAQVLYTTFS